jgi:hypothetical protein
MSDFLLFAGFTLAVIALLGLALSISLIWKGRPVSSCGGASRALAGDCPVCGGRPQDCDAKTDAPGAVESS